MDLSLPHLLYEEGSFGVFLLVTVAMGGGAAWMSGRAIAATWRPWWHIVAYMLILGAGVRFFHFALFEGTFVSPLLLPGGQRGLPAVRLSRLPRHPRRPDGAAIRLPHGTNGPPDVGAAFRRKSCRSCGIPDDFSVD